MYAVIKTGGKQHKVEIGDVIEIEKLVAEGETVEFHPLLVVDGDGKTHVGTEAAKAVVIAKPLGEKKGRRSRSSSTGRSRATRGRPATASSSRCSRSPT
jgi:large subunit ribosomal protein L21